jgi:hypothetical protein
MLSDPEKVARTIKRIFRSADERRQEAELDRDVQIRMGKVRLQRHIARQKKMASRLKNLAKRALSLNDEARFRQVGRQLLWTRGDIQRWEQYLLSLEILETRRDQVKASVELIHSVKAMSESLANVSVPGEISELQRELEQGLARATSLEERMAVMMEAMDATLSAEVLVDGDALTNLEAGLVEEVAAEEAAAFDREIEEGLRKIRREFEKEDN